MFVYVITNKVNGKQYVGQTSKDLNVRWGEHTRIKSVPSCGYLHNAIRKYGADNFDIKPLVIVGTKQEMDFYEKQLISVLDTKAPNGYNLTNGGDGVLGFTFSKEQKQKISKGLVGRRMSDKTRAKLLERNKNNKFSLGRTMPEEHRLMLIRINTGSTRTDDVRRRMSELHKGKKHSEETKRKMSDAAKRRHNKEAPNGLVRQSGIQAIR